MNKNRILLIDDDPVVISLYTALFRHNGFEVVSASDGEVGLASLEERHPDAVLLDLSLPKLNGIDWLCVVRADERFTRLPIVILTASDPQLPAALQSDAVCVLPKKTTSPDEVVESVTRALREPAPRRERVA
jgi:CheY-like chemotaxis protein